jgi:hypothetical protein
MRDTAGVGTKSHVRENLAEKSEKSSAMKLSVSCVEHKKGAHDKNLEK